MPATSDRERNAVSQWVPGLGCSLGEVKWSDLGMQVGHLQIEYGVDAHSLWLAVRGVEGTAWLWRTCYDPAGVMKLINHSDKNGVNRFDLDGGIGSLRIEVATAGPEGVLLHVRCFLNPHADLQILAMPRDLYPADSDLDPELSEGEILVHQMGAATGLCFFKQEKPGKATGFYFQDLSSLNDYFQCTETEPADCVGGSWPELGFALPASKKPLPKGKEVCLSDAYLQAWAGVPEDNAESADWFMQGMANVYPNLERPKTHSCDWPKTAGNTIRSLTTSRHCLRTINGHAYLNAYVGSDEKPPEAMVQFCILVPLMEFMAWKGQSYPLADRLRKAIPTFYDPKVGSVVRWLPGEVFKKEELSEEEDPGLIDSWYLYHIMLNLGRLAELDVPEAQEVFWASLPYAMDSARHFKYKWPVFFKMDSLEVVKAETGSSPRAEFDVPALYVKLMMLANRLRKDDNYVREAVVAAKELEGKGFQLLYQSNNTMSGAVGLLWLWQETADRRYLELSRICLANAISKLWIWEGTFGNMKEYCTFMGMSPLHTAPYISAYEEAESMASCMAYMQQAGDELTDEANLLLSEYCKYLLERGRYYYPQNLPPDIVAPEPKEGHIIPSLTIPLEDIGTGWKPVGQVGQEVYGAAAPLVMSTDAYLRRKQVPFITFCEYPILASDFSRKTPAEGKLRIRLAGSAALTCRLEILPVKTEKLPEIAVVRQSEPDIILKPVDAEKHVYEVEGGARLEIRWKRRQPTRKARSAARSTT